MSKRKLKVETYIKKPIFKRQIHSCLFRNIFKRFQQFRNHNKRYGNVIPLTDTVTDKTYNLDFIFVAFPGLTKTGYRVEGFHKTGLTKDGFDEGEYEEFGTLVLVDGELKVVQW